MPGPAGTGQFTQEDPIGIAGGLNVYGYANGDPLGLKDPFGLQACGEDPEEICPTAFDPVAILTGFAGSIGRFGARFIGATLGLRAGRSAASSSVSLYRAVSQAELDDILQSGFRAGRGTLEGKWFWTNADDAAQFGNAMGDEGLRVIHTEVSREVFEGMVHRSNLDQIGPAAFAEVDDLAGTSVRVIR